MAINRQAPVATPPASRVRTRTRPSLETAQATTSVTVETLVDGETISSKESIDYTPVPMPEGAHATVHVSGAITTSPRKYESLKVSVGIWFPCEPTIEAADRIYQKLSDWVEQKISREHALANGQPDPLS